MDTKGGHTESSAFFSVDWLFYSCKALWEHSWADSVGSEYMDSWPNSTVGTDTVWQQDTFTHILNKTALQPQQKEKHAYCVEVKDICHFTKQEKLATFFVIF